MSEPDDHDLLAQYARGPRENSEAAFTALAERHVNLVYSTALRSVGKSHAAQEIAQAVFIILANKAGKLSRRVVLSGWLYQTTRLTAANFLRGEFRRQKREQEAFMQSTLQEPGNDLAWRQIAPLLDEALGKLGDRDRDAILLRFFEGKSLAEVGAAAGTSEDAAKMRVNRALEKLRKIFSQRGAAFSLAAIAGAISANSVHAAPLGLAKTISALALTKGATAGGSTLALVKGAMKLMAWSKMQTAVIAGAIVLLATGTTVVTTQVVKSEATNAWCEKLWAHPNSGSLNDLMNAPSVLKIRLTRYPGQAGGIWSPNGRGMSVNASIPSLFSFAYGVDPTRIILPGTQPDGGYDYLNTLPAYERQGALEAELKRQFGLVARNETRDTEVLMLKVSDPDKLQLHLAKGGSYARYGTGEGNIQKRIYRNVSLSDVCYEPEGYFRIPVIDETGIKQHYDFDVQWTERHWFSDDERRSAIQSAWTDQLAEFGLELVPANLPLEMLIVEKANN
jgi:uncharacterized protein (TIGR03435 family)